MSLPAVLHPDVVDFLCKITEIALKEKVWNCIEKLSKRQFDGGLRVKKLKGMAKRVWEARIDRASRLIFTYDKSRQPKTGKAQVYIAVQDICLEHDDVSRRARNSQKNPDAAWLDADVVEAIGSVERDVTSAEQYALDAAQALELQIPLPHVDELLGNIQWRVVESESEWQRAIIQQDTDLPLKLTPEEYELVELPGNLLLSGSAGTGKTTVALYRLLPPSLQDSPSGRRLYVTCNQLLVSNAQEQFKRLVGNTDIEIGSIFQFKTLRNLCLEILEASGQLYIPEDTVNFQVFCDLYRAHPQKSKYPTALVWDEIRSIIKGSHLSTGSELLYKKQYERLGSKRSTVIHPNQRHEVYQLAEWYQQKLKQKEDERVDEIDLARKVLQIVKQGGTKRYQLIVCDEVQDFTELQLELLFQLVAEDGNLFFAGDLHQMISPSGFRWEELKQKFYHAHRKVEQKTLSFNFRSVGSLVNLANQLLKLQSRLLATPVDNTSVPASTYGQLAQLITATIESLKVNIQGKLNPGDAILVRTDTDKEKFKRDFQSSFVFTVEEAKGLEFDTVVLVEFFQPAQELWGKVLRDGVLKDKEKPHLQLELNLLYVAITRARRILNIWESKPSQVWNQRELAGCVLSDSSELARIDRVEPTAESWHEQGLYYLKAEFYQQAMECFERSGDTLLQRKVNAKLLIQQREYSLAAEILAELQEWRDAARMFERVKQWQQAAECWANAGETQRQQLCDISGLEAAKKWEDAAQRWEALGRDEDAERCRMNIPEKKAELKAIEFEQKKQWLKAAQQYELAGIAKKAAECRAMEFEKKKQWEQAAQQYELAGMPEKAQECRKFAAKSLDDTGVLKGKREDDKGTSQDIIQASILAKRGGVKFQRGAYQGAIADFNEALRLNPNDAVAYYIYHNRGIAHSEIGDNTGAIADFNQALRLNPNDAEAYLSRGASRSEIGDNTGAIADFNQALRLNPNHAVAYYNRGIARSDIGDNAGAIADFNQALRLNPNHAVAYYNRASVRMNLGDNTGAIADFNQALRLNPNHADAYYNRASVRSDIGDNAGAIADYTQALRLNPNDADAYNNRANVRSDIGDIEGAITDYSQGLSINPNDADAYKNRGVAHRELGDSDAALKDFQKAADLYLQQGKTGNYQVAIHNLQLSPNDGDAKNNQESGYDLHW